MGRSFIKLFVIFSATFLMSKLYAEKKIENLIIKWREMMETSLWINIMNFSRKFNHTVSIKFIRNRSGKRFKNLWAHPVKKANKI